MERISMLAIDNEVEDLTKQIKDLLGVKTIVYHILNKLTVGGKHIHQHLELIGIYKNTNVSKFHLQSKVYDSIIYTLEYNCEEELCRLRIKLKPGNLYFVSDEEYKFSMYVSGDLYIQWRRLKCVKNYQSIYSLWYELCLPNQVPLAEKNIKNILNPYKTEQGLIDELFVYLE